jgi:2-keto-4-pentenoate hydratase/2-oxohepta-3-ene-1,7-dioic acid hydratase in catechol pathway
VGHLEPIVCKPHYGRTHPEPELAVVIGKRAKGVSARDAYKHMTLLPGDIICMGTALNKAARGGAVQNIDLNKLGGPVSVTIAGLGTLTNPVSRETSA